MKKYLLLCLSFFISLSAIAETQTQAALGGISKAANDEGDYNTYVSCVTTGYSMSNINGVVTKVIGISITNSGDKNIIITKLVAKDASSNETVSTSTDTSVLGELKSNEEKGISITLHKNISLQYEMTYTIGEKEYNYIASQYYILSITGNKFGKCEFSGVQAGEDTKKFSLKPSSQVTIKIVPGEESELSKLTVNNTDVTADVKDNTYKISSIAKNTSVVAQFESHSANNPTIDGHEYVDLGLSSGSLWAVTNYGAKNPEDYGTYRSGSSTSFSYWGENWTMPTKENFQELIDECTWKWTTINKINGYSIVGKNGKSLFLPAAGYDEMIFGTAEVGSSLYYLTSSGSSLSHWYFYGTNSGYKLKSDYIRDDYSVRPIAKQKGKTSGISDTMFDGNNNQKVYDLNGIERNTSKKGLVIIKKEDGRTVKAIVK